LVRLLERVEGVTHVTSTAPTCGYDFCAPAGSFPLLFKTRLDSIPNNIPYLSADPNLASTLAAGLPLRGDCPRVGLVWAGRPEIVRDRIRSAPLGAFAPLASIGAQFFSLQKGPA